MEILKIVIVIIVSLGVILPGYFIKKKSNMGKDQKLISAIAGVLMLLLVWLFPADPPGSMYARIGLTVIGIVPIVFWLIDLLYKTKTKD
jgi:hypothetical protein